jgi:hypothetical protein
MKYILILILIIVFIYLLINSNKHEYFDNTSGNTHRLGNFLDAYFFSKIGSVGRKKEYDLLSRDNSKFSYNLGKYIQNSYDKYNINLDNNSVKILNEESDKFWASYKYENIKIAFPEIRNVTRQILTDYNTENPNLKLCNQIYDGKNKHCILHYRLGDFVSLNQTIDIVDIIKAIKNIETEISHIEIMDGGMNHDTNNTIPSKNLRKNLLDKLILEFPNKNIFFSEKRSTDEDFYRMVYAPILVTASGSYAIWASICSYSRIVLTPCCVNLNFHKNGKIKPQIFFEDNNQKWILYDYILP